MDKTTQFASVVGLLLAGSGCAVTEQDDHLASDESAVLVRCPGPSVTFKANPQPSDCQSPSLSGVDTFDFFFSGGDVAAGDLHVYFFDESNANFFTVPSTTLSQANSFHTEWDATGITRAYYANPAGASEEFAVPPNMVGAHHASSNNSGPSANWRAGNRIESVTIARMHSCTYLRTR